MSKTNVNTDCSECFNDLSQRHMMKCRVLTKKKKYGTFLSLDDYPCALSGDLAKSILLVRTIPSTVFTARKNAEALPALLSSAAPADGRGRRQILVLGPRSMYVAVSATILKWFPPSSPLSLVVFHWAPRLPKRATEGRLLVHVSRESQFGCPLLKRGKKTYRR